MSAIVFAATEKCSEVSEADILDQNTHVLLQLLNESVMIDQKRFGFVSVKKIYSDWENITSGVETLR